eukprot:scaffold253615_cov28-Tisochrysis_lutea.AAC.3
MSVRDCGLTSGISFGEPSAAETDASCNAATGDIESGSILARAKSAQRLFRSMRVMRGANHDGDRSSLGSTLRDRASATVKTSLPWQAKAGQMVPMCSAKSSNPLARCAWSTSAGNTEESSSRGMGVDGRTGRGSAVPRKPAEAVRTSPQVETATEIPARNCSASTSSRHKECRRQAMRETVGLSLDELDEKAMTGKVRCILQAGTAGRLALWGGLPVGVEIPRTSAFLVASGVEAMAPGISGEAGTWTGGAKSMACRCCGIDAATATAARCARMLINGTDACSEAQRPRRRPMTRQKKMRSDGISTTCRGARPAALSAVRSAPFSRKNACASARALADRWMGSTQ